MYTAFKAILSTALLLIYNGLLFYQIYALTVQLILHMYTLRLDGKVVIIRDTQGYLFNTVTTIYIVDPSFILQDCVHP